MTSPLRVVMVSPSGILGGAETVFADLARTGPAHELDLTLIALQDGPLVARLRDLGHSVETIAAGRLRHPRETTVTCRALAKSMKRARAQVVVSNMSKAHVYAALPAWRTGIPAVWWQVGIPQPPHWLDRLASGLPAALVLANSTVTADAQRRIPRSPPVRVVYPGADVERYHPAATPSLRAHLGLAADDLVIGIVGRLQPAKGQTEFLRAARIVLDRHPRTRFVVLGGALLGWEGDYPEYLRHLAVELGIADRVAFTGHCDDMPGAFTSLDIVVNASTKEGFGLVVTEAMASGRAVVAFADTGPLETVVDGETGVLCDPGSVDALAAGILRLVALGEGARAAMGARGRERVIAKFSLDKMAAGFAEALHDVVEGRRTSAH